MHQFRSAMAWSSNPKRNRAWRACFGWVAQVRAPGFWALIWATPTPLPLLPNISEYDFGRREGQGHLNTFPAGVPSPRSSNGAVFGIANTSPVKRHHPLPGDVTLIV